MLARKKMKVNRYKKSTVPRRERIAKRVLQGFLAGVFVASVALFAFFSILVYDLFTQSPYFAAAHIEVEGAERLSKEEILETAGLELGVNILAVSLNHVQKNLERRAWIAKARVSRSMPDRITISITERKPMAVLDLGKSWLMDVKGEIFMRCEGETPSDLPIVTGLKWSDIRVADEPMTKPYAEAVNFLQARMKHNWALPASSISYVQVDADIGLTLVSRDPQIKIRLGYDDYGEKLMRLNYVLMNSGKKMGFQVALIDLVDVDRVVVRPREEV